MIARLVDLLPLRLWSPGNLHLGGRLHFCVGDNRTRTIEWNGREFARRIRPCPLVEV